MFKILILVLIWGVNTLKAGIIIPTPDLQQRIIDVIASGKDKQIHNENYSVIANPFNNSFQNCTEHTLNILNAGVYQSTDMTQLKSNAEQHFKPQKIKANPFKLLLGNWFVDDVSTKDHSGVVVPLLADGPCSQYFADVNRNWEIGAILKKLISRDSVTTNN